MELGYTGVCLNVSQIKILRAKMYCQIMPICKLSNMIVRNYHTFVEVNHTFVHVSKCFCFFYILHDASRTMMKERRKKERRKLPGLQN